MTIFEQMKQRNADEAARLARDVENFTPWLGKPGVSLIYSCAAASIDAATSPLLSEIRRLEDENADLKSILKRQA